MNGVILSAETALSEPKGKDFPSDGQMLHFVQHDNPSSKLRQNTGYL